MAEKILVYGHPACPAVPPVRAMFAQAKVAYESINMIGVVILFALVRFLGIF